MRIKQMMRVVSLCAGTLLGVSKVTAGLIPTQAAVEPGVWTSDYYGALAYAEANNIPALVFWANTGCSHCEAVEREMKNEPFLSWMNEHKLVMVFVESDAKVKKWIKDNASSKITKFPYIAVYWPENSKGEMVLEGFSGYKGQMSMYGASSKDSNIQQIMDTVDFLLPDWEPNGEIPTPQPVYYTVKFVVDPAKGTATGELDQTIASGKDAVAPTVVPQDGWNFTGWDKSFSRVTSDLTVTAQFEEVKPEPEPVYCTVKFVVDSAKGTATGALEQRVESGKGATAPTVAANEGWVFDGWDRSFSKVTSDITVTAQFSEPVVREKINPAVLFKKARTLNAVAYKDGNLFGRASITLGKYNAKKNYLKASFKITTFAGKSYSKSLNVTPDEFGDFLGLRVVFASPIKTMTFNLVNNNGEYEIGGESDDQDYAVEAGTVKIGGTLENGEVSFSAEFDDLEPENDNYSFIIDAPMGAAATVKSGKTLNFGAAPKLKYNAYREGRDRWYELAEWDEDRYPNANAVKLSYKPATGVFSGSFKIYASNEFALDDGKKPTLKTYTAKVTGYVVDGVGIGTVSVKVGRRTYSGTCMLDPY